MEKQKKEKSLFISLKDNVYNRLKEYCKATNNDYGELTYMFGTLERGNENLRKRLADLTNAFFFAGMHTALESKNIYEYKYKKIEREGEKKASYFG